jgi:hypothetical protein
MKKSIKYLWNKNRRKIPAVLGERREQIKTSSNIKYEFIDFDIRRHKI